MTVLLWEVSVASVLKVFLLSEEGVKNGTFAKYSYPSQLETLIETGAPPPAKVPPPPLTRNSEQSLKC